jgi:hypothetical protein
MASEPHELSQVAFDETPLVENNHQGGHTQFTSITRLRLRFSPVILIIPIAIIFRLAIMLPSTTNFRILEIAACRFWYYFNDPAAIPPRGGISDDLCSIAGVNQYYAAMASVLAVVDGVGSLSFPLNIMETELILPCSCTWLRCCRLL